MKNITLSTQKQANDNERALISDAELNLLVEAQLAWERWERTRHWWMHGCIDDATSAA